MKRDIAIIISAITLVGCGRASLDTAAPAADASTAAQGQRAPDLKLPTKTGEQIDIRDLEGKVVIVDFWASWCAPCKEELPVLDAMYREHHDRGLEVLAVNIDEDPGDAEALLSRIPVSFPIVYDPEQAAVGRWAPPKMPTSYIVDRKGNISVIQAGFEPREADALEETVLGHLE
jgi:thiol-disulfide isomerase/thioredoxin